MMTRLLSICCAICLGALVLAPAATADFGLESFDLAFENEDGTTVSQAGSHPFAVTNVLSLNRDPFTELPEGSAKDIIVELPPGFVGDPTVLPRCSSADFLGGTGEGPACASSTAVGVATVTVNFSDFRVPVYNLEPGPGTLTKLGFIVLGAPVFLDVGLSESPPYRVVTRVTGISQVVKLFGSRLTIWGNPADPVHDSERGHCLDTGKSCSTALPNLPFLTLPRACTGPLPTDYKADSWQAPGTYLPNGEPDLADPDWKTGTAFTHDDSQPSMPLGMTGCEKLGFSPTIEARPTSRAADSPTGLDFGIEVRDEGLTSPTGLAQSDIRKAAVTLPEGFTANPSLAEGLAACSEGELARETASSAPGEGCPEASKIGTVEVETPLLDDGLTGSLFVAKPYENPFGSLLALYMVIKNEKLGIAIKQPLRVEPNPATGQLTTIAEDLPQLPFSHFKLHFREGARSPLATPSGCGTYNAQAVLTPWSGEPAETVTSAFQIVSGPDGGPCPSTGGLPPLHPAFAAGTLNAGAARYSPFYLNLNRTDSEQEITHFSIKMPPGLLGKLAGIPYCPEAGIAAARSETGPRGGQEELETPSCPAASQIGRTLVGAGVGPALTYAPGKIYLAGPYHGATLSVVAITAAKVGPFDLGTVVVREALRIDPESAEVSIDAAKSDPLPHIIAGIPVHLRDINAYVDRPQFVLNPTSCRQTLTASTVLGSGRDFNTGADDPAVTVTTPFQAVNCTKLPFAPKLGLRLFGGTGRGAHPRFKATLRMHGVGEAAISSAQVTLPHSEFLEQAHIRTICTRAQFAAGAGNGAACPPASIYGHATAVTPILSQPLEGPVFLRSSDHELPDLVAALHNSQIDIVLVGRIDSKGGGIRNTFESVPDAPVSTFTLQLQGGKKGLLANSTDLCLRRHRAKADFKGQNGKVHDTRPILKIRCGKSKHHSTRRH